uniref:Putative secreted protein n=1 Tax=Anopheles marajoara TaxID=58244 RepID=A0A2M4C9U4_9DIPT
MSDTFLLSLPAGNAGDRRVGALVLLLLLLVVLNSLGEVKDPLVACALFWSTRFTSYSPRANTQKGSNARDRMDDRRRRRRRDQSLRKNLF